MRIFDITPISFMGRKVYEKQEITYKYYKMPDGQPHIIALLPESLTINMSIRNSEELIKLGLLCEMHDRQANTPYRKLILNYVMGGRQDKIEAQQPLTIKFVAKLLNGFGFNEVTILHPHSPVTTALIDNGRPYIPVHFMTWAIQEYEPDFLVFPDAGAAKELSSRFPRLPSVICHKQRDPETGKLSKPVCYQEIPEGKGLILDDICDGGGTFLALKGFVFQDREMALYTTHGIFSKGFSHLRNSFEKVFTTNSYRDTDYLKTHGGDFVKVYEV